MATIGTKLKTESVTGFHELCHDLPGGSSPYKPAASSQMRPPAPRSYDGYEELNAAEQAAVDGVLRGAAGTVPRLKQRTVTVYVISAGTDSVEERNALAKVAYPTLKTYCREKHAVEFQAIDLRWGLSDAGTSRDPESTTLRLRNMISKTDLSFGPSIAMILSEKCGHIEIPSEMFQEDFEAIRKNILDEGNDLEFLELWYRKNNNDVPAKYILQDPKLLLAADDMSLWPSIHDRLLSLLTQGAEAGASRGQVEPGVLWQLTATVLERELHQAVHGLQAGAAGSVVLRRRLAGVRRFTDRAPVTRYLDLLPDTTHVDEDRTRVLAAVEDEAILPYISKDNVFQGTVEYSDPVGMDAVVHRDYLDEMCTFFTNKCMDLIDANIASEQSIHKDELYEEVVQHWNFALDKCKYFLGRDDILKEIASYLFDETDHPLVLHGGLGCGKTALVAKTASVVQEWLVGREQEFTSHIILRLCGFTPASSTLREMIHSVCHQIAYVTGKPRHLIPSSYKELVKYFRQVLITGDFAGVLVLLLDGVDGVDAPPPRAWLPATTATNVKVILSTSSARNSVYDKLKSQITNERYHIEIPPLERGVCADIANILLDDSNKMLSFKQWRLLKDAFQKCSLPLYTKMAFDHVKLWRSYSEENISIPSSISECFNWLLDMLERKHGHTFVKHCVAYLSASQAGLSHSEIEDVLSLDDVILNLIFTDWEPSVRRMPLFYWLRFHDDISDYLMEKEVDETTVMYWPYVQFNDIAKERYLQDDGFQKYIHGNLADYFLGKWSGKKPKPFTYTKSLMDKLHITQANSSAPRYVAEQPLVFKSYGTHERFNHRRLNQLLHHLLGAGRRAEAESGVCFSHTWLSTKLRAAAGRARPLLTDLATLITATDKSSSRDAVLVLDALKMCEHVLAEDPNVLGVELTGRLLPYFHRFDNIRALLQQCDAAALSSCPLVPQTQVFTSPGAPLQNIHSNTTGGEIKLLRAEQTNLLISNHKTLNRLMVWDIMQAEDLPDIHIHTNSKRFFPTPNGTFINVFHNNNELHTYRVDSGELHGLIQFPGGSMNSIAVGNKYVAFTLEQSHGPIVLDIDSKVLVNRFQHQSRHVALSADERLLVCSDGAGELHVHALPLLEKVATCTGGGGGAAPAKIRFTNSSQRFIVMYKTKDLCMVDINLFYKRAISSQILHDIEMQDFTLNNAGSQVLVRSSRCLYLYNMNNEMQFRISKMPVGVFVERLSTFLEAGFSADDSVIVAARHTYVCVWAAAGGAALRVFQHRVRPCAGLLLSTSVNRVVSFDSENVYTWNLDSLDANVEYINCAVTGPVRHMEMASAHVAKVICCGETHAEARVYNLSNMECENTLVHQSEGILNGVGISPMAKFAITCVPNEDVQPYHTFWSVLQEVKLWSLEDGKMIRGFKNIRSLQFSPVDDKAAFFACRDHVMGNWVHNAFDMMVVDMLAGQEFMVQLPQGDFICEPVFSSSGEYLAILMQIQPQSGDSTSDPKIRLLLYSFEKYWHGIKYNRLQNMWSGFPNSSNMLDVRASNDEKIIITYANFVCLPHGSDGILNRSKNVPKGMFIFDIKHDCVLQRIDSWLYDNSDISRTQISSKMSVVLDDSNQVFNGLNGCFVNKLHVLQTSISSCTKLVLDGRYVVSVTHDRREVRVHRASDGVQKARLFVHGEARHVRTGGIDDRSVVVTCSDGRVMVFTLLLETSDPVVDIINKIPSRQSEHQVTNPPNNGSAGGDAPLSRDVKQLRKSLNEHRQLSAKTRTETLERMKSPSPFRAVQDGALVTRELNQVRSEACCIQ